MSSRPDARQRDFLLLTIYVLTQHGYLDRARILSDAIHALGDKSPEALSARAVLRFLKGEWAAALACLEDLDLADPVERFGRYRLTEAQRLRRYLKARCLYELQDGAGNRDAVESYLRHGLSSADDAR